MMQIFMNQLTCPRASVKVLGTQGQVRVDSYPSDLHPSECIFTAIKMSKSELYAGGSEYRIWLVYSSENIQWQPAMYQTCFKSSVKKKC